MTQELEEQNLKLKRELVKFKKETRSQKRELSKLEKKSKFYELQVKTAEEDATKYRKKYKKLNSKVVDLEKQTLESTTKIAGLEKKLKKAKATKKKKKTYARIHYWRPDKNYYNWGVHAIGLAVKRSTSWADPIRFKYLSDYGAYAKVELHKDHERYPLKMMVHSGPELDIIEESEAETQGLNRKEIEIDFKDRKEIWLVSGISQIFYSKQDANAAKEKKIAEDKVKSGEALTDS